MAQGRGIAISRAVALGAVSAILLISNAVASDRQGKLAEEFHKVYPLSAQGRIEIENINGPVHITGWDRDEVKVDAVKTAWTKERLNEARIDVRSEQNDLSIALTKRASTVQADVLHGADFAVHIGDADGLIATGKFFGFVDGREVRLCSKFDE